MAVVAKKTKRGRPRKSLRPRRKYGPWEGPRRNWDKIITKLHDSRKGAKSFKFRSPEVARATRAYLLGKYDGLDGFTKGDRLFLAVRPSEEFDFARDRAHSRKGIHKR